MLSFFGSLHDAYLYYKSYSSERIFFPGHFLSGFSGLCVLSAWCLQQYKLIFHLWGAIKDNNNRLQCFGSLLDNPDRQLIRELLMLGVGVLLGGLQFLEGALSTQTRKLHVNYLCIFIHRCLCIIIFKVDNMIHDFFRCSWCYFTHFPLSCVYFPPLFH